MSLYRQTDDDLSQRVVEVSPLFTHPLARHFTAILGLLVAPENSLVVEVFKNWIFDEPPTQY